MSSLRACRHPNAVGSSRLRAGSWSPAPIGWPTRSSSPGAFEPNRNPPTPAKSSTTFLSARPGCATAFPPNEHPSLGKFGEDHNACDHSGDASTWRGHDQLEACDQAHRASSGHTPQRGTFGRQTAEAEVEDRPVPLLDCACGRGRVDRAPRDRRRSRLVGPRPARSSAVDAGGNTVDDGSSPVERDGEGRAGRVGSDAGSSSRPSRVAGTPPSSGHLSASSLRVAARRTRPSGRITDAIEDSRARARAVAAWPTLEEPLVHLRHGLPSGALEEHLGDQHPERVIGLPPGEAPPVCRPPGLSFRRK